MILPVIFAWKSFVILINFCYQQKNNFGQKNKCQPFTNFFYKTKYYRNHSKKLKVKDCEEKVKLIIIFFELNWIFRLAFTKKKNSLTLFIIQDFFFFSPRKHFWFFFNEFPTKRLLLLLFCVLFFYENFLLVFPFFFFLFFSSFSPFIFIQFYCH